MTDFSTDRPIFLQVADYCNRQILSGAWQPEQRVPSTKELAIALGVNNRTVMKAYDDLSDSGIIYQRRGMGYFVAPDAVACMQTQLRREFFENDMPALAARMRMAGVTPEQIAEWLNKNL